MNKLISGICAIVLILSATSCNLFKKSTRKSTITPVTDSTKVAVTDTLRKTDTGSISGIIPAVDSIAVPLPDSVTTTGSTSNDAAARQMIAGLLPLWNHRTTYTTFNGKAKVHLESPKDKNDFTATIRMEKDKKIWVSIVALGVFEAARALITPDTIILVDRLHKEVTILPFKDAGKLLPVNIEFSELQALLIGDALHASADMPTNATAVPDGTLLEIRTKDYLQQLLFSKADSAISRQEMKLGTESIPGPLLVMQYSDYSMVDNRRFASGRVIDVDDAKGRTHIDMQFNRAEFDQPLEFSFSIPAKYTRK